MAALNSGTDREDVVDGILDSAEGRRAQVNDLYVRFLGRQADAAGLAGWSEFLRNNDNIELAARIIASNEYYQTRGGGTDAGFLNAVYLDVLARPIVVDEIEDRDDDFDGGAGGRMDIAESILESGEAEEARAELSARSFLRANVTADQAEDLVGDDDEDAVFVRSLLSDDAYFDLAQRLATTDFATIPSRQGLNAQTGTSGTGTTGTSTTPPTTTTTTTTSGTST